MTVRIERHGVLVEKQRPNARLDRVEKKLTEGPMSGRLAYLSGLAATLYDAKYAAATKGEKPAPRNGGWLAQAPVNKEAAKKAGVFAAVETGIGETMVRLEVRHDGDKASLRMNRGYGFSELTAKSAPRDQRFATVLALLGRNVAEQLIAVDPRVKL